MRHLHKIMKVLESALDVASIQKDSVILVAANPYLPNITAGDIISAKEELGMLITHTETKMTTVEKVLAISHVEKKQLPMPESKTIHMHFTGSTTTISL